MTALPDELCSRGLRILDKLAVYGKFRVAVALFGDGERHHLALEGVCEPGKESFGNVLDRGQCGWPATFAD